MKALLLAAPLLLTLVACGGGKSAESIDQSIVDNNQLISKENATLNAKAYMREVAPKDGERVQFMSDSTIDTDCRFGDGWASGKLHMTDGTKVALKCQTTGSGKGTNGCMTEEEFGTKDYAEQDGKCDLDITSLDKL